jgi:hypothetical protein
MSKATTTPKGVGATFEVRFKAPGLHPAKVPLRTVSDALAAVQDLATGRDSFLMEHIAPEEGIGLVNVRTGSAIYSCFARAPREAIENLGRVGRLLSGTNADEGEDDVLLSALRPIEHLSKIAKKLKCEVQVRMVGQRAPTFVVEDDAYESIAKNLMIRGETTVTGIVQRVGGATKTKCLMRVPERRQLLYCNVQTKELAQRLGQHLYESIVATGTATWIHRRWRIYKFSIAEFSQPEVSTTEALIKELRAAGLDAWDSVEDPEAYLGEMRS